MLTWCECVQGLDWLNGLEPDSEHNDILDEDSEEDEEEYSDDYDSDKEYHSKFQR